MNDSYPTRPAIRTDTTASTVLGALSAIFAVAIFPTITGHGPAALHFVSLGLDVAFAFGSPVLWLACGRETPAGAFGLAATIVTWALVAFAAVVLGLFVFLLSH